MISPKHCWIVNLTLLVLILTRPHCFADEAALSRADIKLFLSEMADDVERWHLKSDPTSQQRGTIYEFVVRSKLHSDHLPDTDQGR